MGVVFNILTLLGSLGLFLYGMTLMSEALQKVAGDKMRSFLAAMTTNAASQIFTGLLITAIIQSSSATTVMVVSFVNAGLLSLVQAIGVIMGANIGTTVTAWLIAFLGFKADISILSIPLIGIGFAFMMCKAKRKKSIGELLIGFALLFLGLTFLKDSVPNLENSPENHRKFTNPMHPSVKIWWYVRAWGQYVLLVTLNNKKLQGIGKVLVF